MIVSNPITPSSTELRQSIMYAKNQIANIRKSRETAPQALYKVLNESLVYWLGELDRLQKELSCLS